MYNADSNHNPTLADVAGFIITGLVAFAAIALALSLCVEADAAPPLFAPSPLFPTKAAPVPAEAHEPDLDRDTPPTVIGAWKDPESDRVIIANYSEALRIAQAEHRPLVVMSRMPRISRDVVAQDAPEDAVLTVADDDPRFRAMGVYRYVPITKGNGAVSMVRTEAPRSLLFFTASWCSACKSVEPLAASNLARIVDVDKEPRLAAQHKATGKIPVLVVLVDAVEESRHVGADKIKAYLGGK